MKKLIVFDLDGTLAESKSPVDAEMAALLGTLLSIVKVAVISGGNWPQFESQVLVQSSPRRTPEESISPSYVRDEVLPLRQELGRRSTQKISRQPKKRRSSVL